MAILHESPLLVLFLVAAAGYLIGKIEIAGFSLGVAAVLFAGLALGAIDPKLALPEIIQAFGLVLFVYGIGISSGPGFFASFRRRGLRDNVVALALLAAAATATAALALAMGLSGATAAGVFAGALTNTPALASVLESMKAIAAPGTTPSNAPAVAYSVTYPAGVIGVIAAMWIAQRLGRGSAGDAALSLRSARAAAPSLGNVTARVTRLFASVGSAKEAMREAGLPVLFGRMKRGDVVCLATDNTPLRQDDLVTLIGSEGDLARAAEIIGEPSDVHLDLDRHVLDFRRIFVSSPDVTEKPLESLRLPERFGAIVTRVRRGDVELLPTAETSLELGDRVRVVGPRERMGEISRFFGDSYKALAEIDVITFGVGVALGLLLGAVPVPLPGGTSFKLGLAGGPLVVGLVLGRLGRTGRLVWTLPYSANLTMRQLGLVLFLAGVGTRSGDAFVTTLAHGGLTIFAAGAVITCAVATTMLVVGRRVLGIPMPLLMGIVSGIHTQPAALAFASAQAKSDQPNVGYASVYPLATIAKIVFAQLLVALLR
ncbi:MAG TPA: aspartate:alanine exchanger family transporter [Labilithrix sp.]|nr:aspartate:alanine exchanger family transporter [Labilithrix sp.]